MPSTVELDRGLETNTFLSRMCESVLLFGCVESVDIGLVMLFVVESHNLRGNVGLEGVVRIGEIGKCVLERSASASSFVAGVDNKNEDLPT